MVLYKDSNDKEWPVVFTLKKAKTIRDKCGVDLLKDGIAVLIEDPLKCVDVIYYASNASDAISLDEFYDRVANADYVKSAVDACVVGLADFTPSRGGPMMDLWWKARLQEESEFIAAANQAKEKLSGEPSGK